MKPDNSENTITTIQKTEKPTKKKNQENPRRC